MKPWHTMLLALIVFAALAVPAVTPFARAEYTLEAVPAEPPAGHAVSEPDISVTITMKSGFFKTSPVNNIDVFLCHATAAPEIEAVRATGKLLAKQIGDFRGMASDLPFMKGRAKSHLQQKCTTGPDGTCAFEGVPPGEYIVFAGYSDSPGAGYWLMPVVVESGNPQQLDFTTKSLNEFFKKP
jgi:hypothetical protein